MLVVKLNQLTHMSICTFRLRSFNFLLSLIVVLTASGFDAAAQATYYVKANATGANTGSSWANAFTSLQSALTAAVSGDQIWVAAGTYRPEADITGSTSPSDPRTKTFLLKNGVKIYGGFAGTESTLTSRSVTANPTILSGDLDSNDGDNFANTSSNAYHVVVAYNLTTATILDGFTVKGGYANLTMEFVGFVWGHHHGGGLLISQTGSNLTVNNCYFTMNYGGYGGGAVYHGGSSPKFYNTVFAYNKCSNNYGGAMYSHYSSSSTSIVNCVFVGNESLYQGGAIYNWSSSTSIVNSTFYKNTATSSGGGIHNRDYSPTITNSIFYGNLGGGSKQISNETGVTPTVTYSLVEGGYTGTGNTSYEPAFTKATDPDGADNIWKTADDGLALRSTSPAANTGSNAAIPAAITTDIIGDTRILNTTVNMGAYETLKPSVTIYVKSNASGANDGTSWANAFTSLQSALELAVNGDQIWVAAGTYKPSKDIDGNASPSDSRTKTFTLRNGVKIYGGFAGNEVSLSARNTVTNQTVLSGDIDSNDGANFTNMGANVYHVVVAYNLTAATVLDGFTVKSGYANVTQAFIGHVWGHHHGGGLIVAQTGSNLTVNSCVFTNNFGGFGGGAVYHGSSSPKFYNTIFAYNKCENNYGGAMYSHYSSSSTSIVNCVFVGNESLYQGGGIYNWAPNTSIINSTFVKNYASYDGGGIHNREYAPTITNSIFYGNSGGGSTQISNESGVTPTVTYSLVAGGYTGTGNLNTDPKFFNLNDADGVDNLFGTTDDGFIPLMTSPIVNAGNNSAIPVAITTDVLGQARIQSTTVNLGAYEAVVPKITQSITGFPSEDTRTFGDQAYTLSATGGGSGNPVVYTSSNPDVAFIANDNLVVIIGAGETTITATQAGNDYYLAAADAHQTLTILKAHQAITFDEISSVTLGAAAFELGVVASSGLDVQLQTSSSKVSLEGNTVSVLEPGLVTITASQQGSENFFAADDVDRSFCINPAKPSITTTGLNTESPLLTSDSDSGNQWFKNDVAIEGATGKTFSPEEPGSYTVQVTVDVCASEVSAASVLLVTGAEELPENVITLYPNPVVNDLRIDLSGLQGPSLIVVYNLAGVEMMSMEGGGLADIKVGSLKEGTYIVKVINASQVITKKFIKN
jgi:hypothetical protein